MRPAIKPLMRLILTFAIVWFYFVLTASFVTGVIHVTVVIGLSIPTWLVVSRMLFPVKGEGMFSEGNSVRHDDKRRENEE